MHIMAIQQHHTREAVRKVHKANFHHQSQSQKNNQKTYPSNYNNTKLILTTTTRKTYKKYLTQNLQLTTTIYEQHKTTSQKSNFLLVESSKND